MENNTIIFNFRVEKDLLIKVEAQEFSDEVVLIDFNVKYNKKYKDSIGYKYIIAYKELGVSAYVCDDFFKAELLSIQASKDLQNFKATYMEQYNELKKQYQAMLNDPLSYIDKFSIEVYEGEEDDE